MLNFLIAVDMEGGHGVQGEKYTGQEPYYAIGKGTDEYTKALISATSEVNEAVKALFDSGADNVYIWDNHGAKDNLFMELVDSRAIKVNPPKEMKSRLGFLADIGVKGIIFLGYHSKAGSFNGIMSHTYNSKEIQFIKINGKQVGELDIDGTIAAVYGVPALFAASDDVCVGQVKEYDERIETVITKIGRGRTSAEYRPAEVVLSEIYEGVKRAAGKNYPPVKAEFPMDVEIRYTRVELAEYCLSIKKEVFGDRIFYGEDANTLKARVNDVDELRIMV